MDDVSAGNTKLSDQTVDDDVLDRENRLAILLDNDKQLHDQPETHDCRWGKWTQEVEGATRVLEKWNINQVNAQLVETISAQLRDTSLSDDRIQLLEKLRKIAFNLLELKDALGELKRNIHQVNAIKLDAANLTKTLQIEFEKQLELARREVLFEEQGALNSIQEITDRNSAEEMQRTLLNKLEAVNQLKKLVRNRLRHNARKTNTKGGVWQTSKEVPAPTSPPIAPPLFTGFSRALRYARRGPRPRIFSGDDAAQIAASLAASPLPAPSPLTDARPTIGEVIGPVSQRSMRPHSTAQSRDIQTQAEASSEYFSSTQSSDSTLPSTSVAKLPVLQAFSYSDSSDTDNSI